MLVLRFPTTFTQLSEQEKDAATQFVFSGFRNCRKKPIIVQASQVTMPFRVKSLEGDYADGKPGDYLMCGIDGELYICDRDIFERTYDFL